MAFLVERIAFFVERSKKIHGNIKKHFLVSLLLHSIKKGIAHFLNAIVVYLQGAKQLIAPFLEHFTHIFLNLRYSISCFIGCQFEFTGYRKSYRSQK